MTRAYGHDYSGAVELYQQVLALRPGDPAVLSAIAEAYEAMDDLSAARFHAEQALERAPAEPDLHRLLAGLRLRSGDTDGAIESLDALLALTPNDTDALGMLARAQQNAGRLDDAAATYARLLDTVGENPSVRVRILQIQRRLGDLEGSAETLAVLVELDPENYALHRQLAEVYVALERPADAIGVLESLLQFAPSDTDARLALADLYRQRGDESSARAILDEMQAPGDHPEARLAHAIALFARADHDGEAASASREILEQLADQGEDATEILFLLGELRFRDGDYEAAADALARALADEPGHPTAWQRLTASLLEGGNHAAAADAAEDALLLFPGQYPLLRLATFALMNAGRNEAALGRGQESLAVLAEEHPDASEERSAVLSSLALIQMRLRNSSAADAYHEEAIRLDPTNAIALNNFAYDLAGRGQRLDEALQKARLAVNIDPENPSFLDTLGHIHNVRGEHDQALPILERAVNNARQRGTVSATILEHLGDARSATGDAPGARLLWQEALELDPERDHLRDRLRRER